MTETYSKIWLSTLVAAVLCGVGVALLVRAELARTEPYLRVLGPAAGFGVRINGFNEQDAVDLPELLGRGRFGRRRDDLAADLRAQAAQRQSQRLLLWFGALGCLAAVAGTLLGRSGRSHVGWARPGLLLVPVVLGQLLLGCQHGSEVVWPPRTGRNDAAFRKIPPGAELSAGIPKDDPIEERGSTVLGPDKTFWPADDTFETVGGSFVTKLGDDERRAKFSGWTFVYKDSTQHEKVRWCNCLTSGEMLLPTEIFQKAPPDVYVENTFEAEDFGPRYILVRLDPAKKHRVCVLSTPHGYYPTVGFIGTRIEVAGAMIERRADGWYHGERKLSD